MPPGTAPAFASAAATLPPSSSRTPSPPSFGAHLTRSAGEAASQPGVRASAHARRLHAGSSHPNRRLS